jgi:glycosyltransferase involved in cell wall biosynthesis
MAAVRILHVISGLDPENGGPTFALVGLAEAQRRAGLDVSVMATWQIKTGFPLAERLRAAGVKVELIGQAYGKLSRHPDLAAAVDRAVGNADVVHVHALWEEIQHQAPRAAQRRGVPYVVTPHGMLAPWSRTQGGWVHRWGKRAYLALRLRKNLERAAAIHFTTPVERDLVAPMRLRATTIVEPVGIDFSEFEQLPPRGLFRRRYPQLGEQPLVLFLSRLSPQKGLDVLIPAFAQLKGDAMLVLAGPDYDNYGQSVRGWVTRHKLEDRVIFTGMLHGAERIQAFRDADLFVLPSHHENFGIVVAEAMAVGTPVVISREVNIWQEVLAAGAGAAVQSGDDRELSAELTRWLADPAMRAAAGEKARAFARSHYDWGRIAKNWVGHYAALVRA